MLYGYQEELPYVKKNDAFSYSFEQTEGKVQATDLTVLPTTS